MNAQELMRVIKRIDESRIETLLCEKWQQCPCYLRPKQDNGS
jgi:hypothetical protein